MSYYVDHNLNFISNKTTKIPLRRRSEGRLKTYNSSEDLRSWNFTVEDRRRQILDVVKSDIEKCGQLSTAILQALSHLSKAELARNLKKLWNFFMSRNLSPQKKKQLLQLQKQMGYVSIKAIQGCVCVGSYDLVCVCHDENYFKHRNLLLHVTQSLEEKLYRKEPLFEDNLPKENKPYSCTTSDGILQDSTVSLRATTLRGPSYEGSTEFHQIFNANEPRYADKNEGFDVTTVDQGLICDRTIAKSASFQTEPNLVNKRTGSCEPMCTCVVKATSTFPSPPGSTRSVKVEAMSQEMDQASEAIKSVQDKLKALERVCKEQQDNIRTFKKERDDLERQIQESAKMDEEREKCAALANKVKILESRLEEYSDTSAKDLEEYKNKNALIDTMLAEREEVQKKMEKMNEMEAQLMEYKKRAAKAEEQKGQLRKLQREKSSYDKIQTRCMCLEHKLESVIFERDDIQERLDLMQDKMDSLRAQAREAEMLMIQRDKLQIKLNDMIHAQVDYENLQLKCKYLETSAKERDMYKQQYESQLHVKCENECLKAQVEAAAMVQREKDCLKKQVMDLQSCIIDQKNDAQMLLKRIDGLIKNKDEIQSNTNDALASMRAEIEKKDNLLASADLKLYKMQSELKKNDGSCETSCYKARIEDLQNELNAAREHIAQLERTCKEKYDNIKKTKDCEYAAICLMKKELNDANKENEKLQEIADEMAVLTGKEEMEQMLKESECTVKKVAEELSQRYYEWDQLNKERRRSKSRSSSRGSRSSKIKEEEVKKDGNKICPGARAAIMLENSKKSLEKQ